ncbi:MAG TPA: hypothetical protein VFA87_09615 [Rhizomicrobium sp.]|nr:hypothetical protein [Rhizomicrobium sp.]
MTAPVKFEVVEGHIRFFSDIDDAQRFSGLIASVLKTRRTNEKSLVWVYRAEFTVQDELVVLFVDEDGSAFLEMKDCSNEVFQAVAGLLRQSPLFQDVS